MNVAIIVEGPDDYETYPVLIRKVHPEVERVRRVQCGGIRRLRTRFVGFLKNFSDNPAWAINKALVIRDSDCAEPKPLEQELNDVLQASRARLNFPVQFYATKCKLETLLLADEDAINQVSLRRAGAGGIRPVTVRLETYNDADAHLKTILGRAGLPDNPIVYAEIAHASDISRITERCPYFREFTARIRDC